ncbi:tetratricopeptide repeat protein [Streptomyces sp. NPDC005483]|uniref:tetratricopeptide repeat protein n=1 Tax=Streptomyces sp. NPDC005483 TaxID=3154882 RepID=UPI0033A4C839
MERNILDAYASILSIPPVFDEALALDFGTSAQFDIAHDTTEAVRLFGQLRLCGIVVRENNFCWKVEESFRNELLRRIQKESHLDYQNAVRIFLEHANNGFSVKMKRVLGENAAEITSRVLRLELSDAGEDFNTLVEIVQEGARRGRGADARCTVNLLSQLPYHPDRERQENFFEALWLWRHHDRIGARDHLECVLAYPHQDLASAISAHLLAVMDIEQGKEHLAISLLERSLSDLESIDHERGRALVLTTMGRAQREIATRCQAQAGTDPNNKRGHLNEAAEYFSAAHSSFDEATLLAGKLNEWSSFSKARLELAVSYEREGNLDKAIQIVEEARQRTPSTDRDLIIRGLTQLGSLYRKRNKYAAAASILDEALRFTEGDQPNFEIAKLLNVIASAERKQGNLAAARQHAESSVSLGRRLGNARHTAHALSNLAAIVVDDAASETDLSFAIKCLDESQGFLRRLNDVRGLGMVAETRGRIQRKAGDLEKSRPDNGQGRGPA